MRTLLLMVLLGASVGCAKKHAPQSPNDSKQQKELDKDKDATDNSKPDDPTDEQDPKTSDDDHGGF
ncbi:MAG: hypothetical protein QM831_41020 [Kofleriaceae bacterium]